MTNDEFYLGQIIHTAYTFRQEGWMLCDGETLPISQYQALFSLLGNRYGGDGTSTFAVPDMRENGIWPANKPVFQICINGIYPCRD